MVKTSFSDVGSGGLISGWGAKVPTCFMVKKPKQTNKKKMIGTLMKWLFMPISFVVVCCSTVAPEIILHSLLYFILKVNLIEK